MTSNRPYLIRAIYDWLVDNNLTPHLLIDVEGEGVVAPVDFAENGRLVLNVSPSAVRDIYLGNDMISFNARFNGKPTEVFIPPESVLGIYARENEMGMLFAEEPAQSSDETPAQPPKKLAPKIVDSAGIADMDAPQTNAPRPPKGRPSLKVIK